MFAITMAAKAVKAVEAVSKPVTERLPRSFDVGGVEVVLDGSLVHALPGMAKVGAIAGLRTAKWTTRAALEAPLFLVKRVASAVPAAEIAGAVPAPSGSAGAEARWLKRRGEALMRLSADIRVAEAIHPAYGRILDELTPDEARILRFLHVEGAQPCLDVRTGRLFGVGSELIAAGLNMIGELAGCRHVDRTDLYLTNLSRLGLVEYSDEPVADPGRYQLIEAQPKVTDAKKLAGRTAKDVRRSVRLNRFGSNFCAACLPDTPAAGVLTLRSQRRA